MDIPIGADVQCEDKVCGKSTYLIFNPVTEEVTHVVVKTNTFPHIERMVPIHIVAETSPSLIHLSCTSDELSHMEDFIEAEYISVEPGLYPEDMMPNMLALPYATYESWMFPLERERIPVGEMAVRRGAEVRATDGHVGRVDEFLVDPRSEHITHLVMREGHLWGQKDITIPISAIDHMEEDIVYLKLDRQGVESLPAVPVRRRQRSPQH